MSEAAGGMGTALDATVKVDTTRGSATERPAAIPDHYIWDEKIGPTDDNTGQPTGGWREPTAKESK